SWCSWLSRQSNTLKVSGSNPGEAIFISTPVQTRVFLQVFPINMKGSAGSLVTLVSWLGSWVVSYAFNFMMGWSSSGTFFMFSCIGGVTVVFVLKLVPETKGRTLEEIQASMNPFSRDR
ncbi:Sugar transporter ERD6-like 5, partial [Linum perenne]